MVVAPSWLPPPLSPRVIWLVSALAWVLGTGTGCGQPPDELVLSWPAFRTLEPIPVGVHPNTLALADFDSDGDIDIAIPAVLDPTLVILANDGRGGFERIATNPWPKPAPGGPVPGAIDVEAADIDGDAVPELLMTTFADNRVAIASALGSPGDPAGWTVTDNIDVLGEPACLAIAQLIGAEHVDLAVTRGQDNDLMLLAGDGLGGFQEHGRVPLERRPTAITPVDIDGNGQLEIAVVASIANTLTILAWDDDSGRYQPVAGAPLSGWPASLASADLDGDGDPELIGASNLGNTLFTVDFTGPPRAGSLALNVSEQPTARGAFGVALADFDGDGFIDVAVAEKFADTITLFRNRDGSLAPETVYPVGAGPTPIATADLDGDGTADLVVANGFSNDVHILLSRDE